MAKKTVTLKQREEYLGFLEKRLNSKNYKNNVSAEEYAKTKAKYEKEFKTYKLLKKFI